MSDPKSKNPKLFRPILDEHKKRVYFTEVSLRDLFAAAALSGYCANPDYGQSPTSDRAEWSYADADAMLAEREKSSV